MSGFYPASNSTSSLENKTSYTSSEKESPLLGDLVGTQKIKYHAGEDWDFLAETSSKPIDLSLVLPHYRARHQPVDHRLSMYLSSVSGLIKAKVCRQLARSRFVLEIQAATSDVTVWLPSDFVGHVHHTGRALYSDGFINRIMRNVHINETIYGDEHNMDEVIICTQGRITFRMWDINTCAPEHKHKEAWKRMFGCTSKAPETAVNWDFLLED